MTVCAAAPDATISAVIKTAAVFGCGAAVDFIGVAQVRKRLDQILKLGPHYICCHLGIDEQNQKKAPVFSDCFAPQPGRPPLMVAGGMKPELIRSVLPLEPEVIVVGGYVTGASDPSEAAKEIQEAVINLP